jgi:hypothetical protein
MPELVDDGPGEIHAVEGGRNAVAVVLAVVP